ncbi:MAG: hypothetical protein ACHBN1_35350 [Heteroscytonema crispum UTEX LB 1556]
MYQNWYQKKGFILSVAGLLITSFIAGRASSDNQTTSSPASNGTEQALYTPSRSHSSSESVRSGDRKSPEPLETKITKPPLLVTSFNSERTKEVDVPTNFTQPIPPKWSDKAKTTIASSKNNFPLTSCGDKPSGRSDTWWPVFIDGGNLAHMRTNYCADAISTKRENTGVATVQLGSFTSYEKAFAFAQEVGGKVGISSPSSPAAKDVSQNAFASQVSQEVRKPTVLSPAVKDVSEKAFASQVSQEVGQRTVSSPIVKDEPTKVSNQQVGAEVGQPSNSPQAVKDVLANENANFENSQEIIPSVSVNSFAANSDSSFVNITSSGSNSSGNCNYPDDLDSRGRHCGAIAASERPEAWTGVSPSSYSGLGSTYVRGYTRKDGTYVRGHYRSRRR